MTDLRTRAASMMRHSDRGRRAVSLVDIVVPDERFAEYRKAYER